MVLGSLSAQEGDFITNLTREISRITAELALLGFVLAAFAWTICWLIIIVPYTPRRYKEWAYQHRVSIIESTFWFALFNTIVSIILWFVSLGG
jgi:uncharacterized membrane protein